jgi:hypothetical protein
MHALYEGPHHQASPALLLAAHGGTPQRLAVAYLSNRWDRPGDVTAISQPRRWSLGTRVNIREEGERFSLSGLSTLDGVFWCLCEHDEANHPV